MCPVHANSTRCLQDALAYGRPYKEDPAASKAVWATMDKLANFNDLIKRVCMCVRAGGWGRGALVQQARLRAPLEGGSALLEEHSTARRGQGGVARAARGAQLPAAHAPCSVRVFTVCCA